MKALLIGGPKHGKVLAIKGGVSILTYHEGKQYEYLRQDFMWSGGGIDAVWPIYVYGEISSAYEVLAMVRTAEIQPIGKARIYHRNCVPNVPHERAEGVPLDVVVRRNGLEDGE